MLEEQKLAIYQSELKRVFQDDPLKQNIAAVMTALLEPVDADYIAGLANNPDGATEANQIEVTSDQVGAFIELIRKVEQKSKLSLLEEQPLEPNNSEATDADAPKNAIQERRMGYRFSDDFRSYVEHEHPELCKLFHGIVATKLLSRWETFKEKKHSN